MCEPGAPSGAGVGVGRQSEGVAVMPPPIQPCSGYMGNGKSVIRPIAFKPLGMGGPGVGAGGRLSAAGERYGSTPALASRPPSHHTLYGSSSDVRESRWCGSPQPASLSALPPPAAAPQHHRHHSALLTKTTSSVLLTGVGGGGGCGIGAGEGCEPAGAPSPADSGVAELEHAGAIGARPGPSPRHADGTGVHQDYSPSDRIPRPHEARLRTPRALMLSYGGRGDRGAGTMTVGERDAELVRVRRERALLRQRLEDTEWSLCQRAGEIALLKTQLKDAQNEQTAKGHEYLTMKADCRQLREALDRKEKEIIRLRAEAEDKDALVTRLRGEVERLNGDLRQSGSELAKAKECSSREIERLKTELKELRQELSDVSLSGYEGIECGRTVRGIYDVCKANEYHWSSNDSALEDAEVQRLNGELPDHCAEPCPATDTVNRLKIEMDSKEKQFNSERRKWSEEKDKVLRYQKQLQLNYVQMYRRSRTLEAEVDSLRLELELCNKNVKNLAAHGKPIEL